MSTPDAKRRRLNESAKKLARPFKSPLRSEVKKPDTIGPSIVVPPSAQTSNLPFEGGRHPRNDTSTPIGKEGDQSQPEDPPRSSATAANGSLPSLQSRHTALLRDLNKLRSDLDTATQALKIESSHKDVELHRLVTLWKKASQQAAEELFAGCKDRVNRMGGVGAWMEKSRERERGGGWAGGWEDVREAKKGGADDSEDVDGDGEEVGKAEKEEMDEMQEERERGESNEIRKEEDKWDEDGGFTMDMMLRSLGIETTIVGFDVEGQRWMD
ncbi:hypothetical protein MMC25_004723 [Agyrium rufum]|nr:hypothetical protein [Agyrium rufum]